MATLNDAHRNAIVDAIGTVFDAGTVQVRTGTRPGAGEVATGTVASARRDSSIGRFGTGTSRP